MHYMITHLSSSNNFILITDIIHQFISNHTLCLHSRTKTVSGWKKRKYPRCLGSSGSTAHAIGSTTETLTFLDRRCLFFLALVRDLVWYRSYLNAIRFKSPCLYLPRPKHYIKHCPNAVDSCSDIKHSLPLLASSLKRTRIF